ncbi:MAG: type II toxin-antitoxin system CcdA family antitoxin [Betaproteobacteria bacterium]
MPKSASANTPRATARKRPASARPPADRADEEALPVGPAAHGAHSARQTMATYDVSAPKRATNVSVNADLLDQARQCGLNLSQTLEDALKLRLADERRRKWLENNREAIEEYNRHLEKHGLWSDGIRMF